MQRLGHNAPDYVHLVSEALKFAFADRAMHLGDADHHEVPIGLLTSRPYAESRAARILRNNTLPSSAYGTAAPADDAGTTHYSVMDARGNAVACTETINTNFGSLVVVPEYGIVLNNEMDDFTARPGEPNAFGLLQSAANAVAPGKKPLSSMSPTIGVRDGKAVFALGGSGGPRIITATLQVLLNLTWFQMNPQDAVAAPRFHHQWMPETLYLEPALAQSLTPALQQRQHAVQPEEDLGAVQLLVHTGASLNGASDPRKHGKAAGY
jgi:gamma-glutamyltranspeptidase/glutathione hydrolase